MGATRGQNLVEYIPLFIADKTMTSVSISYDSCLTPDMLQDHHNREGELLVGIPVHPLESLDELKASFMEDLNCCTQADDFPWEEVEKEVDDFFAKENIAAYQQDFSEDNEDSELQWWFLIQWGEEE